MESLINPFFGVQFPSLMKADDSKFIHPINSFSYEPNSNEILFSSNSTELVRQEFPSFYICEVIQSCKRSIGIIAALPVNFLNKRILPHENTLHTKTFQYIKDFNKSRIQFNPVLLLHKNVTEVNNLLAFQTQKKCDIQLNLLNITYKIWTIYDKTSINKISYTYNMLDFLFIADGHHRLAGLSKLKQGGRFMAFLLSEDKTFNHNICRVYQDIKEVDLILDILFKKYKLIKISPFQDNYKEGIRLISENNLYLLKYKNNSQFDYYINESHYLFNILENVKPFDGAINFCNFPWDRLEVIIPDLLKKNKKTLKFLVPSIGFEYLFNIINKGEVLPPHSTWFEPKLPNNFVSFMLDY